MKRNSWKQAVQPLLLLLLCSVCLLTGCSNEEREQSGESEGLPEQQAFLVDLAASLDFNFAEGRFSYELPKKPSGFDYAVESFVEKKSSGEGANFPAGQTQIGNQWIFDMGPWEETQDCHLTLRLSPMGAADNPELQKKSYDIKMRVSGFYYTEFPYYKDGGTEAAPKRYSDWRCAYKDLIEAMCADGRDINQYVLYDVDKDKAPELFLGNGAKSYVFTFDSGRIFYLGDTEGALYEAKGEEENDFYVYGAHPAEGEGENVLCYRADYYRMNGGFVCRCDDHLYAEGITNEKGTKLKSFRINGKNVDKADYETALKERFKLNNPVAVHSLLEDGVENLALDLAGATPTGRITLSVAERRAKAYADRYGAAAEAVALEENTKLYGDLPWADFRGYTLVNYSLFAADDYHAEIFYTLWDGNSSYYVMEEALTFENTGQTWVQEDWRVCQWQQSSVVVLDEEGNYKGQLLPEEGEK